MILQIGDTLQLLLVGLIGILVWRVIPRKVPFQWRCAACVSSFPVCVWALFVLLEVNNSELIFRIHGIVSLPIGALAHLLIFVIAFDWLVQFGEKVMLSFHFFLTLPYYAAIGYLFGTAISNSLKKSGRSVAFSSEIKR